MNAILCTINDLRLFTRELLDEIAYKVRGSTWRDVWAWFLEPYGIRLALSVIIAGQVIHLIYVLLTA